MKNNVFYTANQSYSCMSDVACEQAFGLFFFPKRTESLFTGYVRGSL